MHRCSFAVAALLLRPADFPNGILDVLFSSGFRGAHADLFAVIHQRRRAGGEEESGHQFGNLIVMNAVAVTIPLARLIVIAEKIVRLPANGVMVYLVQQPAEIWRRQLINVGNLKIHWQLNLVVLCSVHLGELGDIRLVGLADQHRISGILVRYLSHFAQHLMNFGQIVCIFVRDIRITISVLPRQNRVVVQIRVFK